MKRLVEELSQKVPFNGLALHGTPYRNVEGILRDGIVKGHPYVCPIPRLTKRIPPSEILERVIGSTLFAGKYGLVPKGDVNNPHEGELPAIVLLKGNYNFYGGGYDDDRPLQNKRGFSEGRQYRSFGKQAGSVPPSEIVGIVRITPEEHREMVSKAKGDFDKLDHLTKVRLSMKTLRALRELIEKEKEPDYV